MQELIVLDVAIDFKTFSVYFHEDDNPGLSACEKGMASSPGISKVLFMTSRKGLWLDAAATRKALPVNHVQLNEDIDRYRAYALCGR